MTWLFIRFYLGVLVVLTLAWYIHGDVSEDRSLAERARVVTTAHAGGARLVAQEIDSAKSPEQQEQILYELQSRFDYPIAIMALDDIPDEAKTQFAEGADLAYRHNAVFCKVGDQTNVVRLGKFPSYTVDEIEASLAGWMRLAKEKVDAEYPSERPRILSQLQSMFAIDVHILPLNKIPGHVVQRIVGQPNVNKIAFYTPSGDDHYYSVIALADQQHAIRFGSYPSFEAIDQKVAAATLALVLLPAAIAIALLLRPVQSQLRQLENAAEAIAAGDLSARVDQSSMNSAKPLAQAFNHMASRTETLVRTQRELLQAVSHELRTPLSRMRFAIDLIGSAKDDTERNHRLESLDAATEELDGLVGELLSYVRMETAELQIDPEVLHPSDAVGRVIEKFATVFPDVQFTNHEVSPDSDIVWADQLGFQRAIGNLVGNAGRHAKRQVSVTTNSSGDSTIIDVDDDGLGIPHADRQRVFEPFVRLAESAGGPRGGVGLGLALVKRIVVQNGGAVEVLESPWGGCRVRTVWPRGRVDG